jgi:SAM-dependent methyltransferase
MDEIYYDRFLSNIYDDAPYFGQARSREPDLFNRFYFDHLTDRTPRVLEFGSGTGGLTIALARAGFMMDSVDISPYMHEVLVGRLRHEDASVSSRVRQIVADATTYKGAEPYESIVMPEGILIAIPDREVQLALLDSCHRNLRKGGRILTDFFQPRYKVILEKTVREYTRFRTRGGDDYLLSVTFRNDEHSQIQDWEAVFTRNSPAGPAETIPVNVKFRYLFYSEIQLMLERCGFKVIDIVVGYAGGRGFSVVAAQV